MTKDEALAALREELTALRDACCIHQDEYGTHYAPNCEGAIDKLEAIIDTVQGLHETAFVADWIEACPAESAEEASEMWCEEMGQ